MRREEHKRKKRVRGGKREKREGTNQQDAKVRQRESFLMSSEIHREISRRESVGNVVNVLSGQLKPAE